MVQHDMLVTLRESEREAREERENKTERKEQIECERYKLTKSF